MTSIPTRILIFAFTTAGVMAMVSYARPQDADRGQIEFLLNCAGCHGTDAKGSGPESAKLHLKPVDLTVLAKRNHGRFDPGAVYRMIDGRNARLSHHSAKLKCRFGGAATKARFLLFPQPRSANRKFQKGFYLR